VIGLFRPIVKKTSACRRTSLIFGEPGRVERGRVEPGRVGPLAGWQTRVVTSSDVVIIRPRKIRRVCWVLAPTVLVFFIVLGAALHGSARAGTAAFQPSDRAAMGVLGVLVAGAILVFTRPKVVADSEQIAVQNFVGGATLPWEVVRAVRFDRGNSCLTLELEDDDVLAVWAVQAADKEHAVAGARELRRLHAVHRAAHAALPATAPPATASPDRPAPVPSPTDDHPRSASGAG
jgi:Bacterial PH domain